MTKTKRALCRPVRFAALVGLIATLSAALQGCVTTQRITRMDAQERILSTLVKDIQKEVDPRIGLRVHRYDKLLPEGARVEPVFAREGERPPVLRCRHPSWLFFVDEAPGAHFAHPVRFVLLDAVTGKQQVIRARWWPQVDGQPIFDTVTERRDPQTIIHDQIPQGRVQARKLEEILGGPSGLLRIHDPCSAWAMIVCGYDDLPDTFEDDTNGIYDVLTGLGVADDHIFYVSPHTGDTGVDRTTSLANVEWVTDQVAAQADETDKVLFFYSSHGDVDSLSCVPTSAGGGYLAASDLDNWLDDITCDELTVIVEACHSGSLIGRYASGTYVAAEDDLTGDGETNRCVFTSASSDTASYADCDWPGDPNPGDVGSETIWGYVEAFSTAAADTDGDSEVSFGEGWQYAWDNDITRIDGVNTPQMVHTGLIANNVYDYCYRVTGDGDLFVADGPGDVGHNSFDYASTDIWVTQSPTETDHHDVVSGMDNLVHVAVHNRGTTSIANGSLNLYWADSSTATAWPDDFNQIGSTHTFSSLGAGATHTNTWTWYVDPSIGLGHNFCLVAVADSPDDPMTGGLAGRTYVAPYDNNIAQLNISIIEDSGDGHGTFQFALKNNTEDFEAVDLVVEWVGSPRGSATLLLPRDLFAFVDRGAVKLENLRRIDVHGQEAPGLRLTGKTAARLRGIPLKPGESRVVSLDVRTQKTRPGERCELRLRQEVQGTVIGALTTRLQQVDPADPGWVTKASVMAFADLGPRFRIAAADRVRGLFARTVAERIRGERRMLSEVLSEALTLEREVHKQIPPEADGAARKAFRTGLDKLERAVKRGDMRAALRAQGMIADAAKDL